MRVVVLISLLALGCSNLPEPQPMGPVPHAPAALAALRVHVYNATDHHARAADESSVTGFTILVRGAVQEALLRAGFVVVVEPDAPRDVVLVIHSDYQSRGAAVGGALVTSLRVEAPGGQIAAYSATVRVDEGANIIADDAVDLVSAMGRSTQLARYADQLTQPRLPCAPPAMRIAEP